MHETQRLSPDILSKRNKCRDFLVLLLLDEFSCFGFAAIAGLDAWGWLFASCWLNTLSCCCNAGTFSSIVVSTALNPFFISFTFAFGVRTRIEVALFCRIFFPVFEPQIAECSPFAPGLPAFCLPLACFLCFGITLYVGVGSTFGTLAPFLSSCLPFLFRTLLGTLERAHLHGNWPRFVRT